MDPTQQDLMDAACWFDSDKAGSPEMTAFKREARWRQHRGADGSSLPQNADSRARLARLFGVNPAEPSDVVFEWSPGRRSTTYTNDRTAFDVALRLGDPAGPRTVVVIETKYHEHCTKEKAPGSRQPDALRRHEEQTDFLVAIAEASGVGQCRVRTRAIPA